MDYRQLYDRLAVNFLGRSLASGDGLPAKLYYRAIPESLLRLIPQFFIFI